MQKRCVARSPPIAKGTEEVFEQTDCPWPKPPTKTSSVPVPFQQTNRNGIIVEAQHPNITPTIDAAERSGWWSRPCGGREVLQIAVPLIISTGTWTVMNFCDRMFLLWYSKVSMAACMPAGMVHFAMVCFPLGVATYVGTFVAQYHGAGQPQRIGHAMWQGIRLGFYCCPLFLALVPLSPWIFRLAGHELPMASHEALYFQTALFGAGAEVIAASMAAFFTGRGVTWVVMLVDSSASLLNIALDWAWIFGHCGLPEMGIEGAAWATVVSLWWRVVAYAILILLPRFRQRYHTWSGRHYDAALFRRLLRFGGPSGMQLLVDIAGFTLFLLLVGNLGKDAMAATNLAFNVNCLAFVPTLGLGMALGVLVGQQLGKGYPDMAARATWTSLCLALGYMGTMALIYLFLPHLLLRAHEMGMSPNELAEFANLRDTTIVLLRFVAAYCLFDAMCVVFSGALKGAGDTRFILITSLVLTPVPVVMAWVGLKFFNLGLLWCWIAITLWVCAFGVTYCVRFLQGHWRQMRVIEPELIEKAEAASC
jgi:multidrug resistance protein, MATE family